MPLIEFDNRGLEEISVDSFDNSLVITSKLCDRALRNQFEGYRFLHMRPQTSATNQFAESAPIARVEYLQTAHSSVNGPKGRIFASSVAIVCE
jgi:hypothetical protein